MSWSTIRAALKTRIEAACTAATFPCVVHDRLRWSADHVDEAAFQSMFVVSGRLSTAQITRRGLRTIWAPEDARRIKRHEVAIYFDLALDDSAESEDLFQDALESIADNLMTGDDTLGGVCKALSDPVIDQIQVERFAATTCHGATLLLTIEEVA
jgi:hypothetical protein